MERHDWMTRAARFLLGAGTFAAAVVAMTAGPASAQTTECIGEAPLVCGHVFTETTGGDDTFQFGEGTSDVTVVVTDTMGNVVASAQPNNPTLSGPCTDGVDQPGCGYYSFDIPESGDYLVCIVLQGQSFNCADAAEHPETKQVTGGTTGQTADFEVPSNEPPPPVWGSGTGTPGYWKNHSSAWPVNEVVIGDPAVKTWKFSKEQAIAFLNKPVAGDKTYTIFASLVSAMLNVYGDANNPECIASDIADAHHWFSLYGAGVGVGSGIKAKSDAWVGGPTNSFKAGEPIHSKMDDYNNGKLCAPHRN